MGGGGGGGGGGSTVASTQCPVTSGSCASDGSSSWTNVTLTAGADGIFTGTLVTNQCSNHPYGRLVSGGVFSGMQSQIDCVSVTIPAAGFEETPVAAPIRGALAFSISGGVNVYGPFEAGFVEGQACTNGKGTCAGGVDVPVCESKLIADCGEENVNYGMLLDTCAGHANPYHYHKDLACDYAAGSTGDHSPLVAIALDGRGLYGLWEGNGSAPTNLDACNGHTGPVPAYTNDDGVSFPAQDNVYHYHTSETPPYTIGCYGPVASIAECKTLFPTCDVGFVDFCTASGSVHYDTDCPCFSQAGESYNTGVVSADCTVGEETEESEETETESGGESEADDDDVGMTGGDGLSSTEDGAAGHAHLDTLLALLATALLARN
jgi:hypothetical protein